MSEVNTDLAGCALAVHQAIGIWNLQAAHALTPADRAPTPGLLSDDQTACSFTNENIYDLANIQVPGTPAGKHLGQLVARRVAVDHLGLAASDRGRPDADEQLRQRLGAAQPVDGGGTAGDRPPQRDLAGGGGEPSARHPPPTGRPPCRRRDAAGAEVGSGGLGRAAATPARPVACPAGARPARAPGARCRGPRRSSATGARSRRSPGRRPRRRRTRARRRRSAGRRRRSGRRRRGGSSGRSRGWTGRRRRRGSRRPT